MIHMPCRSILEGLGAILLALLPVDQAPVQAGVGFERDLAFARGLVDDLGLLDLAEEVLDGLLGQAVLAGEQRDRVLLEKARLRFVRARSLGDAEGKWDLVKSGLRQIDVLAERIECEELKARARELYLRGALDIGALLEFLLEEQAGPEARAARLREADTVYRTAIESADKVRAYLDPSRRRAWDTQFRFWQAWLTQGELVKQWAFFSVEQDRALRVRRVRRTLEDLIFEFCGESEFSLRGMLLLVNSYELVGDTDQAKRGYLDVIQSIWFWAERLNDPDCQDAVSAAPWLARLLEEAYFLLIRLHNRLGKTDEALAAGAELAVRFGELQGRFGNVRPSLAHGMRAVLEYAVASRDSGAEAQALEYAMMVSAQAGNEVVGLRARRLIRRLLEETPRE